jgi:hypothetical protein
LIISAPGLANRQVQLDVRSGEFKQAEVSMSDYNPYNCPETNHSSALFEVSQLATSLHELASTGAKKTRKRTERTKWGRELNQTAAERLADYQTTVINYPAITLACPTPLPTTCSSQSLREQLAPIDLRLKSIRKAAVRANNVLVARGVRNNAQARKQRDQLKSLMRQATRILRELPRTTDVCG